MDPVRIGLIGCGTISPAYLRAAARFDILEFAGCADIDPAAARKTQADFGVPALSVEELLARDDIEVVLNLTVPAAHGAVNLAALEAGKHAYCEKPFGLDVAEGERVLGVADAAGLRVGCAPDTFLGGGHQSVRRLIDDGAVGRPVAATAFMMGPGHESWHPNPAFYYQPGGGPLFDMGPYYLTALVNALGPVRRVAAVTARGRTARRIGSKPRAGEIIEVNVDTHVAGTLEFQSGVVATVAMSFDVRLHSNRFIEIHGLDASLSAPDPNGFGGKVRVSSGRGVGRTPLEPRLHEQRAQHRPCGHVRGHPHRPAASLQRPPGAACARGHGRLRHVFRRGAARGRPKPARAVPRRCLPGSPTARSTRAPREGPGRSLRRGIRWRLDRNFPGSLP